MTALSGEIYEKTFNPSLGVNMVACHSYQRALELDHQKAQAQQEFQNANAIMECEKTAEMDFKKLDFQKVVFCIDRALKLVP
jgi:DnaJ family protein C protein 7